MIRLDQAFAGKRILVTGATGFLGKVFVSKLLHDAPSVGRVVALIRKGRAQSAAARMEEEIVRSPALSPLAPALVAEKLEALEGDTGIARFGLGEEGFAALAARIDVVVHCAGVVDFSPPLDEAISVNVDGTIEAIALARAAKAPLVHISTCYVSGAIEGRVEEGCEKGDHPDRSRTGFAGYDAEREIEICRALVERIKREQDDPSIMAEHLREKGGDLAAARKAAQDRARTRQREEGKDRARRWGFPNSYTYSKSLAEQLVVKARDAGHIRACVVRPAILESAARYPFPGWNQGANTTAPLVYMTYRGHRFLPLKDGNFLDVLPIDMCAGAMVAIAAAHIEGKAERCYQLGSGDTNKLDLYRAMQLTALYYRKRPIPGWSPILSLTARRFLETTGVSERLYRATSLPFFAGAAKLVSKTLARIDGGEKKLASALLPAPEGAPADDPAARERRRGLARALKNVRRTVGDAEKMLRKTATVIDEYLPFIHGARPIYSTRNARALREALSVEDRDRMYFEPESIDWRRYWHEVHLPGMEKWTFPELDRLASRTAKKDARGGKTRAAVAGGAEESPFPHHASSQAMAAVAAVTKDEASETRRFVKPEAPPPVPDTTTAPISGGRAPSRPATLLDILEGAVRRDGTHAMLEGLSGREVHARVLAGAARLRARGVGAADRVALVSENSSAWVIGYFAILAAGGTAVPLDATLSAKDVAHLGRLARAKGIYASAKRRDAFAGAVATESLEDLAAAPEAGRPLEPAHAARDPEAPASLIFTSGTTGAPKGVLLPHRAFCSQVAALSQLYVLGPDDRVLSVLPAHHAFEFTCGLMLPLFSGATVHFAGAATPEAVRAALKRVRPTAMIAVPALLEAFLRSIRREVRARGDLAAKALEAAIASHRRMRDATGKNLGRTLFKPAHDAFGGDLRLLVSGGASLASSAFEAFRGLGFDIYEGYGLTEAGPVVTTCRPGRTPRAGSVGDPIPGTEVRLARLRPDGAGEIEVRGPGLTLGYDENPAATALLLGQDGWLRTGDLGKADEDGCISIVGRVKDVIVDGSGNTVYPDEVEEAYAGVEGVSEVAVARVAAADGREVVGALALARDGASEESIQAGFRAVDATLPFWKRVKVLRFASAALPRTATRKMKREEVSLMLAAILERERTGQAAAARIEARAEGPDGAETAARLKARRMVAELAGKDPAAIPADARLGEDLGLDSLAQVDLAAAIAEETGRALPKDKPLEGVATVADVARLLASSNPAAHPERSAPEGRTQSKGGLVAPSSGKPRAPETPRLPGLLQTAGNNLLSFLQYGLYDGPMRSEVTGRGNIPQHTNALVVSNHASHLDVGLVKHALGEYGRHAASLGARDYFFSTPLRRLYFENFTEVVPFDRQDTSREKLDEVVGRLASGESVIIFPEGTRAQDGRLGQFRSGLGYLVLKSRKGVLPIWLEGTHRALPKGAQMLRSRDLGARIGRYLPYEELMAVAAGLGRREAYRAIGTYVRAAIERLRDKTPDLPEAHRGAGWRALNAAAAPSPSEAHGDASDLDAPSEIDAGDSQAIPVPALALAPAPRAVPLPAAAPETPEAKAGRLLRSLPGRHKPGRITRSKSFYVKFGEGHDDRYTIALTPERCTVTPGKGDAPADCVVRSTPEVLEKLIVEGSGPSFEDIAVGAFKTNDPDALTLLVEALGLGENAVR